MGAKVLKSKNIIGGENIFGIECSTLLHSFVIFPVTETFFGMSGCFPVSQGQEMKDLTASSGRKATRGCQCSFSARVWPKNKCKGVHYFF